MAPVDLVHDSVGACRTEIANAGVEVEIDVAPDLPPVLGDVTALRSALPMNLKAHYPNFTVWSRAKGDIQRITDIWRECLGSYGGPYLFGATRGMADAMYAPVATRFLTYDVKIPEACLRYCRSIMAIPEMKDWVAAAKLEPDEIEELDMDF